MFLFNKTCACIFCELTSFNLVTNLLTRPCRSPWCFAFRWSDYVYVCWYVVDTWMMLISLHQSSASCHRVERKNSLRWNRKCKSWQTRQPTHWKRMSTKTIHSLSRLQKRFQVGYYDMSSVDFVFKDFMKWQCEVVTKHPGKNKSLDHANHCLTFMILRKTLNKWVENIFFSIVIACSIDCHNQLKSDF